MLDRTAEALDDIAALEVGFGTREPGLAAFHQFQNCLENYLQNVCEEFTLFDDIERLSRVKTFPRIVVPILGERRHPNALAVSMRNLQIQFLVEEAHRPRGGILSILGYDWFLR